MIDISSFNWYY